MIKKNKSKFRGTLVIIFMLLLIWVVFNQTNLETSLGLNNLFQIRGPRPTPPEVVIVAMDEKSTAKLGMSAVDFTKWRALHAKLLNELQRQQVALIVFDLHFVQPQPKYDLAFAAAIRKAGNVIIADCVTKQIDALGQYSGWKQCPEGKPDLVEKEEQEASKHIKATLHNIKPTEKLLQAALDHAPFFLAKDPEKNIINEGWMFMDELAEQPTLPLVIWAQYLRQQGLLKNTIPSYISASTWLTEKRRECLSAGGIKLEGLNNNPNLKRQLDTIICPRKNLVLDYLCNKLIGYDRYNEPLCINTTKHLDFYGPAKSIRMESYNDVYSGRINNLKDKVVFVGQADTSFLEEGSDAFAIPFSVAETGYTTGIEIIATQFSNLLENRFIEKPCDPIIIIIGFMVVIGVLFKFFPKIGWRAKVFLSLALAILYLSAALWLFKNYGWWLPTIAPLVLLMVIIGIDMLNINTILDERIRSIIPPGRTWTTLVTPQRIYSVCLNTDIQDYTKLCAEKQIENIWQLLKTYYDSLGQIVDMHHGVTMNVQGDAIMVRWQDGLNIRQQRQEACLAALKMQQAVDLFNQQSTIGQLPTRIGIHEGEILLVSGLAGIMRYFSAFGTPLNVASRIQTANKYLGTRILASSQVAENLPNIHHRLVGTFVLRGYNQPLELVELLGEQTHIPRQRKEMDQQFNKGLQAFRQGQWSEARGIFNQLIAGYGHDGPSQFYLNVLQKQNMQPPHNWQGFIVLAG